MSTVMRAMGLSGFFCCDSRLTVVCCLLLLEALANVNEVCLSLSANCY